MATTPYHVEVITWNTGVGKGQGLGSGIHSQLTSENFGHASLEIAFPYSALTQGWVDQYCKNIQLYRPAIAHREEDEHVVDIPVFYTTVTGLRIDNPAQYLANHPDAELVTHVYLSWAPGESVPLQSDRDPFKGEQRQTFALQLSDEDKMMEHQGEHAAFRRGYQGQRLIEQKNRKNEAFIQQGIREIIHLTPAQTRFFAMTPAELKWCEDNVKFFEILSIEHQNPHAFIDELKANLRQETMNSQDVDFEKLTGELLEKYASLIIVVMSTMKACCHQNNVTNFTNLPEHTKTQFFKHFIVEELPNTLNQISLKMEDLATMKLNMDVEKFEEVYDEMTQLSEDSVESLVKDYESIFSELTSLYDKVSEGTASKKTFFEASNAMVQLDPEEANLLRFNIKEGKLAQQALVSKIKKFQKELPQASFFYHASQRKFPDRTQYFKEQFKIDLQDYLACQEEINLRKNWQSIGTQPDSRILLPLADLSGTSVEGHPEGLDVLKMLKSIPQIVADGEGYNLQYKNCSDLVQDLCYAGAPSHFKTLFARSALGTAVTPQVVANGAEQYARIIYDKNYQAGQFKPSLFSQFYLNQERQSAKIYTQVERLKEKITFQDSIIDYILEHKANPEHSALVTPGAIAKGIYDGMLAQKNINPSLSDKEAIYAYCDSQYAANIEQDKQRLYPQIEQKSELFAELSSKEPNPLSPEAIEKRMHSLYPRDQKNKRSFEEEAEFQEALYLRACHTIIYENAAGYHGLTDPNYISMSEDRKQFKQLKQDQIKEIIKLTVLRTASALFHSQANVQDPWFELKFANMGSGYVVNTFLEGKNKYIQQTVKAGRILLLSGLAVLQAIFIAPRRIVVSWFNQAKQAMFRPSKQALAKASIEERQLDWRFAYLTQKTAENDQFAIEIEHYLAKSRQNIQAYELFKQDVLSKDNQAVKIKSNHAMVALVKFNQALALDKVPYFDRKTNNLILKKSHKVQTALQKADHKTEKTIGLKNIEKIEYLQRLWMNKNGELDTGFSKEIQKFDPALHPALFSDEIKNNPSPQAIRQSLLEATGFVQSDDANRSLLTKQEILALSPQVLLAIAAFMTNSSYEDRLNLFEKHLIEKMMSTSSHLPIPFDKNHPALFKEWIMRQGLDPDIIHILEQAKALEGLATRLNYTLGAAKSVVALTQRAKQDLRTKPLLAQKIESSEKPAIASNIKIASHRIASEIDRPIPTNIKPRR